MQFAANVVSFASPSTYFGTLQSAPGSLKAFFYAALAWVFGFLLLFVWVVSCFITNSWPVLWVLPTLRTVSQLSSQVLFIPLLTMLLKGIACGNAAQPAGAADVFASCSSVEVQVLVPTGAIVAALFVLLCALFTLVYYDSNPLSLSVESRAHGRAELALLIARTLLVVIVDIFPALLSPWANLGVCAFAALVWLVPAVKLLPYYEATMNRINIAAATSFAWAVCCLALSLGRADVDVGVLLFMSLPLSVLAGLYLHDMQVMRIQRASVERLATPYEVEIKARLIIHAALFGHATDRLYSIVDKARGDVELGAGAGVAGVSQRLAASGVSQRLAASGAAQRLATPGAAAAAATAAAGASLQSGVGGAAASVAGLAATAVPRRAAMDVGPGGEEDDAALDWIASVRQCFPAEAQAQVIALYRAALLNFRSSAMLHVFFARFHQTLMGNRHLQLSHLLQAERMQPPIDVSFVVFQARKAAEDGGGAQLSAIARVEFEKYLSDARKSVQRAGLRQLNFFTELVNPLPDLPRLHRLSSEMNASIADSERNFARLFALDPQSVLSMRLCSSFNEYVLCNSEKAALLASEAERIDEHRIKEHQGEGRSVQAFMSASALDVMGEATAVVTIASTQRHFGLISSANTIAAKLFGFLRLQLERRSIFSLFPRPLAQFFEALLAEYMATGEGELSTTRVTYVMHRNGYTMPVLLSIREAPPSEGPPTFVVFVRQLVAPETHVLLEGDAFTIVGASLSAMTMLGFESAAVLQSGGLSMRDCCPGWDAALAALAAPSGELITLCSLSDGGGGGGGPALAAVGSGSASDDESCAISEGGSSGGEEAEAGDGKMRSMVRAHLEAFAPPGRAPMYLLRFQHATPGDLLKLSSRRAALGRSSGGGATAAAVAASPLEQGGWRSRTARSGGGGGGGALSRALSGGEAPAAPLPSLAPEGSPGGGAAQPNAAQPNAAPAEGAEPDATPAAAAAGGGAAAAPAQGAEADEPPPPPPEQPRLGLKNARRLSALLTPGGGGGAPAPTSATPRRVQVVSMEGSAAPPADGAVGVEAQQQQKPRHPPKGEGSVHKSESSGASSVRKSAQRLRRLLTASEQPLLYGLNLLRIVGILVSLLAIVLASVVALQTQSSFTAYSSNLVYTLNGGMRVTTNFNIVLTLEALVLNAKGFAPLSAAEEAAMRAALIANATEMQNLQNAAFNYIQTAGKRASAAYTTPFITALVYDAAISSADGSVIVENLQNSINLFVSKATTAANLTNAELADDENPYVKFILVNCVSGGNVHESLHATVGSGFDLSYAAALILQQGQNIVFYTMMSLLCGLSACFCPCVWPARSDFALSSRPPPHPPPHPPRSTFWLSAYPLHRAALQGLAHGGLCGHASHSAPAAAAHGLPPLPPPPGHFCRRHGRRRRRRRPIRGGRHCGRGLCARHRGAVRGHDAQGGRRRGGRGAGLVPRHGRRPAARTQVRTARGGSRRRRPRRR